MSTLARYFSLYHWNSSLIHSLTEGENTIEKLPHIGHVSGVPNTHFPTQLIFHVLKKRTASLQGTKWLVSYLEVPLYPMECRGGYISGADI